MKLSRLFIIALFTLICARPLLADDGKYTAYQRILLMSNDSAKCARLMSYADLMGDSLQDYDFALLIFEKANAILKKKNYPSLALQLHYRWGYANYKKGDFEAADKLYLKALSSKLLDTSVVLRAKILNMAGANLQDLSVYKRALIYFNEALELYTKLNDAKGKGTIYLNMANVFALTGNLAQSNEFFDKALKIFKQNKLMQNYSVVLGNKAVIAWRMGNVDSAKALLYRSLRVDLSTFKDYSGYIGRYFNLGLLYGELKQWDSCFYFLHRGREFADSLGQFPLFEGQYYYDLGYSYAGKPDAPKAIYYYKKALGIKNGIANYKFLYDNIAALYFENKQYDSAFLYTRQGMEIADSVYKSELKEHITFENKRLELLERDYQIEIQSAMQEQSLHRLEKRNYLLVALVIILATLMMFLFLYFRQYRLRVKKEHLQSELDFLKAQLNPHFLFNSINNIYVLLDENKDKASAILLKFSELMRYQLYECNVSFIHLIKELQFLENYIEFEKLRYSNKIHVNYAVHHSASGSLLIAPLLLQPFIENAFKHTPKNKNQKSQIDIRVSVSGSTLLLEVRNTVDAREPSALPGGIGLENVRKRLRLLYSGKHELKIDTTTDNFYHISLKLTLTND